jgi:hypothetical protein
MTDILTIENDLQIANNDLVMGESTLQHQNHLLISVAADIKEDPLAGVGLQLFLKDETTADGLTGVIKEKFERDGMNCKYVNIDNEGKLVIDASYK